MMASSSSDYKLRIWVRLVALVELIIAANNSLGVLCTSVLTIGAHYGWGLGKNFVEGVRSSWVSQYVAFLQHTTLNSGSLTIILVVTMIQLLLYLVQTFASLSLIRGCAPEGLDPTRAFQLVRVWRDWTLALSAVHTLDAVLGEEGLRNIFYLIPMGITIFKFVLVLFFLHEIKGRIRADHNEGNGGSGVKNKCDDDDDTKV